MVSIFGNSAIKWMNELNEVCLFRPHYQLIFLMFTAHYFYYFQQEQFYASTLLSAGGIMFSGCPSFRPSVHPSVRSLKYPLLTCTWVRWSTRPTVTVFTACPSVRPSVCLSIGTGFWAFAGERIEGMAWNFTCWCIFRTDYSLWPRSVDFYNFGTILT